MKTFIGESPTHDISPDECRHLLAADRRTRGDAWRLAAAREWARTPTGKLEATRGRVHEATE